MLRRSLKWSVIYVLEAVAVLLALVIFGVGAILWRLSSGPVELDFLREDAQAMLASAFEGEVVALGSLNARYDTETGALLLVARDVTVAESGGDIVTRAPLIEAGLAVDALLFRRLEPVSINIVGGSVSIVRRADGAVGAGLGSVERVAATARLPARGGDESASLFEILRNPSASPGGLRRLQSVRIDRASVRIVDEILGIAWLVQDGGVTFDRDERRIRAAIEGQLATPSGFAPIELRLEAGAALDTLQLVARFEDVSPAGVFPASGPLAAIRALDAPARLEFVLDATRDQGIRAASLELEIGEGSLLTDGRETNFAGAQISASYDPLESLFTIHRAQVHSELFTGTVEGRISNIGHYRDVMPMRGDFDLVIGPGFIDLGDAFERPPRWEGLTASGSLALDQHRLVLDQLEARIDTLTTSLSGEISLSEMESGRWLPNIRLSGPIEGDIDPETVLAYWPIELADGAREWVEGAVIRGDLLAARFDLDLNAEAIEAGVLANDRMTLTFDVENAAIRYISTMTPLTDIRGTATLRGNAFEATLESGRIGNLEIVDGRVDIPRLNPKGAMARYRGTARGPASDILALIDEPPLELASQYGLDPAAVGGEGEIRFEIRRPMLSDVPPEDIPFQVDGRFFDTTLAIPGTDFALSDGDVRIAANQDGIEASGTARLLDTPVAIRWAETFGLPEGSASTRIVLEGDVDARVLDAFNLPARRYLSGPVGIRAEAVSDGLDFHAVDIHADLERALLELPGGLWSKEAGTPGQATLRLSVHETGSIRLDDLTVTSQGLDLSARAGLAADGRLLVTQLDRLVVDGIADLQGQIRAAADPGGPLQIRLAGRYADVSSIVPNLSSLGAGPGVPLAVSVDIARLVVSDTSMLDDFSLIWRSEAAGIRAVSVSGQTVEGPFQAYFGATRDGDVREFHLESPSVERLLDAFGAGGYARGGRVTVLGSAPPLGVDGPLTAQMEVSNLTLVQLPILARILAAGSFQGLAALLNGDGIHFDTVDAELLFEDGLLTIGEARARGSALGVTAAGTIDLAGERAAIDGNLVPSYVVNSLLGELPLIGGLLVSRPGEGVIGVTYSVEGPFDGLTVFANPLSALAPGVLRRIFEGTAADRAADRRDARQQRQDGPADVPIAPQGSLPEQAPAPEGAEEVEPD